MGIITKSQHYIPKMVLRNFCTDDGKCWELNLNNGRITKRGLDKVCCSNYLYEIRNDKGEYYHLPGINSLEKGFSKIEYFYSTYIKELLDKLDGKEKVVLDSEERENICLWISILLNRNPLIKNAIPIVGKDFGFEIKNELSKSYNFIEMMPMGIENFFDQFKRRIITFLKSSMDNPFVITDIPVLILDSQCEYCYTPLSSDYAVLLTKPDTVLTDCNKCPIDELSSDKTDDYNMMMYKALWAYRNSEFQSGNSIISSSMYVLTKLIMTN